MIKDLLNEAEKDFKGILDEFKVLLASWARLD